MCAAWRRTWLREQAAPANNVGGVCMRCHTLAPRQNDCYLESIIEEADCLPCSTAASCCSTLCLPCRLGILLLVLRSVSCLCCLCADLSEG